MFSESFGAAFVRVSAAFRRRGSFSHERSRSLLRAAPARRRVPQFSAFVQPRARRTRSPRRSSRHICASEFRRAKPVAPARRVVPGRDRVFLRNAESVAGDLRKLNDAGRVSRGKLRDRAIDLFQFAQQPLGFRELRKNGIIRFGKFIGDRAGQLDQPFAVAGEFVAILDFFFFARDKVRRFDLRRSDDEADRAPVRAPFPPC